MILTGTWFPVLPYAAIPNFGPNSLKGLGEVGDRCVSGSPNFGPMQGLLSATWGLGSWGLGSPNLTPELGADLGISPAFLSLISGFFPVSPWTCPIPCVWSFSGTPRGYMGTN